MAKKSLETKITPIHRDLRGTLEKIKQRFKDKGVEISIKEASLLANEKIKRADVIDWDEAQEILFRYGYSKR